ncbi:PREDICTED: A-kinase anchor protein SPHKAP [Nanorana parkeri]|uniref:A-kinase anchor protein SPHKAP n=1 Tax=Nanorana parkeri TaxID=125878 RepID=UPI0008543725|nr:PREDICTED: A-kinase anchor protein SPHKAP [Nanorana parkeri]
MATLYGPFDKYGSSGGSSMNDTSTSNLGSSITVCKKVICPSRPADSLEYWLQNSKNLSRIGLVDRLDFNCASICFVNLNAFNEESRHEAVRKKLDEVSPDLQRLINSVRSQELKEDEILLLSGLANRKCGPAPDSSQIFCPDEVCLLQREGTPDMISSNYIILELNKFLLGLELTQENHLQADTSPLRAEDDTNCSVSSIEEDFLTASEHLEEDSEGENCKEEPPDEIKKVKRKGNENRQNKKNGRVNLRREEHLANILHGVESRRSSEGRRSSLVSAFLEKTADCKTEKIYNNELYQSAMQAKQPAERNLQHTTACEIDHCTESFEDPASTGQYATNLAECVLQDAFIRLSQSDSSFTKEAAVSISAGDSLLSGVISKERSPAAVRSWNDLPKIVIVQSPDSCDSPTEWVDESHWSEQENTTNVYDHWTDEDGSSGSTQSTLEVALACAASVIGTISSPQTSEQSKVNQLKNVNSQERDNSEESISDLLGFPNVTVGTDYSLPTALCELTRVASAVAVCGLGGQKKDCYPSTSSGLLVAADASTAVALHCSIALGTSMEKFKDSIAKVLLKEAAVVLTSPSTYKNVGEFIESMNNKILTNISSSKVIHVGDVVNDDLAHNLSDMILRHSAEKESQKLRVTESQKFSTSPSDFVTTTTDLLYNVMHFTCKKMSDLVETGDLPLNTEAVCPRSAGPNQTDSQNELPDLPKARKLLGPRSDSKTIQLHSCSTEQKVEPVSLKQNEVKENVKGCYSNGAQSQVKPSFSKQCLKRERYKRYHDEHKAFLISDGTFSDDECRHWADKGSIDGLMKSGSQENVNYEGNISKEINVSLPLNNSYTLHTVQVVLPAKHPISNYYLTEFADDLAETVVSMATEIAAICLENSNGKQPWFCAWAKGSECLLPPCRTVKRKKEATTGGAVVRRHRPPRLSEIKKKTDEHPELKERLMNQVVDESMNLEDVQDPVNAFANEVALKIMNLTEPSVADSLWQGQNVSRNRLHCERWSRGKASSYESIPEEDLDAKRLLTLGPGNTLGQLFSRTSSVSKQSSCESITDEFSRFMVNQMENEGREFELLLDYYAGKNASSILNSALQQLSRRNSHLNVRPTCLSKQSSTESITEEFYRYMLKEIDKDNEDNYSSRNTAEWTNNLMPPSPRTPFCFRQSSMPCNRSSSARLTVNTPVKANSLDGFARSSSRDFLSIQPVNAISSTNLCKSDSCLYQRCHTDQATDMLIHETWSSSIEALMRKNKIIADRTESIDEPLPAHVDNFVNKLAVDIVQSGKSLNVSHQDSLEGTNKGSFNSKSVSQKQCKFTDNQESLVNKMSFSTMEVPLIQIEAEQREETDREDQENVPGNSNSEDKLEQDGARSIFHGVRTSQSKSLQSCDAFSEVKPKPELPTPLSSSEDSTGSWSHLVNEEENPEDTSSFLQLSERSTSNGNCSTTSSVGAVDLDAFLEVISPEITPEIKPEEKTVTKDLLENPDECTSGLSVGTASCHQEVSVLNIDLNSDSFDSELCTTLQWIAASELGIPTVYFRNSQESRIQKFLQVTRLVQSKSWKVGDIFSALILHCKIQEQGSEGAPSFFDWLLELG